MAKERLDKLLFNRGLAPSVANAAALIMAGLVYINGEKAEKAGEQVKEDAVLEVRDSKIKYVSRGGFKLEKAIEEFEISLENKCCMDIGASTGGFTDCMLQNGASRVYSVDVAYGQLAWKLRCDERVVNYERCNFRYIDKKLINEEIDFFSADVSFISVMHIFPVVKKVGKVNCELVCLVKPQFEALKEQVGNKGVVRDESVHIEVLEKIREYAITQGFSVKSISFSPITGPEGNIEFLMHCKYSDCPANITFSHIEKTVSDAHIYFQSKGKMSE